MWREKLRKNRIISTDDQSVWQAVLRNCMAGDAPVQLQLAAQFRSRKDRGA
jgi:hypothetical protein